MHVARTASRKRRRARLRFTALPTLVPTANPTRAARAGSAGNATQVIRALEPRDPDRRMRAKSREEVNRSVRGIPSAGPPLDGEPRAPFPAPPGQHGATGAGAHTCTESVHALPATGVGLIRALHGCLGRGSLSGGAEERQTRPRSPVRARIPAGHPCGNVNSLSCIHKVRCLYSRLAGTPVMRR